MGQSVEKLILASQREAFSLRPAGSGSAPESSGPPWGDPQRDLRWFSALAPRYQMVQRVQRGGQGVVYQAIDLTTDDAVAIKVLREGCFSDPLAQARFQREADILQRLKHPHIVNIRESRVIDGHAFLVMDYVEGVSLVDYVENTSLPQAELLGLFAEVSDTVHAAHLRGVIHRDLKPSNILVDDRGHHFILDFGLAKEDALAHDPSLTQTGLFLGSLPWASPEQARGDHDAVDLRSDVYSLGIMLYRLVTGQFPYDVSGSASEVIQHIRESEPLRFRCLARANGSCVKASVELETVVLKCLAKEPERRYQSAGDLAEDLRRLQSGAPILAKRDSPGYMLRKYLLKNKAKVISLAAFLLAAIVGLSSSIYFWRLSELTARSANEVNAILGNAFAFLAPPPWYADPSSTLGDLTSQIRRSELIDTPTKVQDLIYVGSLLTELGDLDAAQAHYLDAIELCERHLKPCHPLQWEVLSSFANDFLDGMGDFAAAEEYHQRARATAHACFPEDPMELTRYKCARLVHLAYQDRTEELRSEIKALLDRLAQEPDIAQYLRGIGDVLNGEQYYDEAESVLSQAVSLARSAHADASPSRAEGTLSFLGHTLNSYGITLRELGRLAEAEAALQECVDIRASLYAKDDPHHFYYLVSRGELGEVFWRQGRFKEAEPLILDRAEIFSGRPILPNWTKWARAFLTPTVAFYESWNQVNPGAGHGERAANWRSALDSLNTGN